jgi:site-specific recombinase XerD
MRQVSKPTTPAEMYDRALHYARDRHLPADYPRPHPTADWPAENVTLLENYCEWLRAGGASPAVIRTIYLPMAGHVLGLALKPHPQLDLETDIQKGLDFLKAKQMSAEWTDICRNSLLRFRRFLRHQRGQVETKATPYQSQPHTEGLPSWLVNELEHYQHLQQRNWRPARLQESIGRFWYAHLRIWRFLCEKWGVKELAEVKRQQLVAYVDQALTAGSAISSINSDLRYFHAFLKFLQDQEYPIPQALLRFPGLKPPERLPKFLTDAQVRLLRDDFEQRVAAAPGFRQRRDALLDRAAFYLLWQSGMRVGEVEELRLEDLDLENRRLMVRQGKGLKDRTVWMTDTAVRAVQDYLQVRGSGPTDHIFLYRNQPLCKDLIGARIKAAGERVGVKVHPHRLRHTAATQLLNAGCRVTSIQKFLGHKELSTTMIYARVHDQTVAQDYYAAISEVEKRLELVTPSEAAPQTFQKDQREQLLVLAAQLTQPELSVADRLQIAAEMSRLLLGDGEIPVQSPQNNNGRKPWEHPPPSPVFLGPRKFNPILCGC